jgi:aryl-alcohol dehydrogenase-like predicted oxidoreductase
MTQSASEEVNVSDQMNRREFVTATGGLVAAVAANAAVDPKTILNHNPKMEYRRLGKTGLMVSAVCLGGHWKRLGVMMSKPFKGMGASKEDDENLKDPEFLRNRADVVTRCVEVGINYVDACSPQEILAYSKVLKGRRDKMYFGFSWHTREPRFTEWRDARKLVSGLEAGLKEAGLEYVDVWRISLPMEGISDLGELRRVEEATVGALELAKKQGKTRFTGVSSHNRVWLKSVIEEYPDQIQVVLFPYTAASKELPDDSIFDAIKEHNVGVFGIKPFANNSLFSGNSAPNSPTAEEDDRKARLAIRYILSNPGITAPIPGLINLHQVDNVAKAVMERRKLDRNERAELDQAGAEMWAKLPPGYEWLRQWEYV